MQPPSKLQAQGLLQGSGLLAGSLLFFGYHDGRHTYFQLIAAVGLVFSISALVLDTLPAPRVLDGKNVPLFWNTLTSLQHATVQATLCIYALIRVLLAAEIETVVASALVLVRPLAVGYLAFDLWDLARKSMLKRTMAIHHVGAMIPAAVGMFIVPHHRRLALATMVVLGAEVNSVFIHTRRACRSLKWTATLGPICEWGLVLTHWVFRMIPSAVLPVWHLADLAWTGDAWSAVDAVLLPCEILYLVVNAKLTREMQQRKLVA